jgi:hypothetical protein
MKKPDSFYRETAEEIGRELADRRTNTRARTFRQRPLDQVHHVFRKWFGNEYDLDVIDAVLAVAAAERLDGDPAWLLVISGPGAAKTETTQALAGAGALVTSTIASEGALLSATPKRDKGKDATGGLLRRIGDRGILVIKDVTSILSMNRDLRSAVLAALREIHDGRWERNVGTEGGRSLLWTGRITVIGAVTTVWDRAHDVIASMGDRFVMLRMDSSVGRQSAREHAMRNTGQEATMRAELANVVGEALVGVQRHSQIHLTRKEQDTIGKVADIVTRCRTGVDFDYRGDVIDSHAPEMPTRFAKQLVQVMRGAIAIGAARDVALRLALRCARDSMPPLRLAIIEDIAATPHSRTTEIRRRVGKPRSTVDRQLQALHALGVLKCDEVEDQSRHGSIWYYDLADDIDASVLRVPDLSPHLNRQTKEENGTSVAASDISGTGPGAGRQ